jgi:hypothetical protein
MSITTVTPRPARSQSVVRRHPLISFFVLTYTVAWLPWAPLVIFRDRVPGPLGFVLVMLGSLVPSTVGVLFVALLRGRSGVRTLLRRLLQAPDRASLVPSGARPDHAGPTRGQLEHPARR